MKFFAFKTPNQSAESFQFKLEDLEPRMMLSTVQIFAAGAEGGEQLQLQIAGNAAETFTVAAGDFQSFTFETVETITADDVRIVFLNDNFDASAGFDSNLIVDAIEVDGNRVETESNAVFSTGTFLDADGIQPGFRNSETLHANGFFQFSDGNGGSNLTVRARGAEGGEQFNLILNGQVVQTFTTSTSFSNFNFDAGYNVNISDISVEFFGDQFDPAQGIDTNLDVDFVEIDGRRFETEATSTFSTGTFLDADGIVSGFRQSETLHTNGIFSFNAAFGEGPDTIQVVLRGTEGTEEFVVSQNGFVFGSGVATTEFQTYSFSTSGLTPGADLRIDFLNDQFDPANGINADLIVDNVTINGDTRQVEDASTFGFGTFVNGGFSEGFNQSQELHTTGFFEVDFSTSPIAFTDAGSLGIGILSDSPTSLQFGPDGRLYVCLL